jgi:hypothetical protein
MARENGMERDRCRQVAQVDFVCDTTTADMVAIVQSLHYNRECDLPTIARFGAVSIRMYADDHRPPHFHIVGPEFHVLVAISNLRVLAGVARSAEIRDALAWARLHRPELEAKWLELNERG